MSALPSRRTAFVDACSLPVSPSPQCPKEQAKTVARMPIEWLRSPQTLCLASSARTIACARRVRVIAAFPARTCSATVRQLYSERESHETLALGLLDNSASNSSGTPAHARRKETFSRSPTPTPTALQMDSV